MFVVNALPRSSRAARACTAAALVCLLIPASLQAQDAGASAARQLKFWGFNGSFGTGGAGGDFGNLFTRPVTWDYGFFRQQGSWRVGAGLTFASFKMKDPYQDELEWGFQQIYLQGTRMLRTEGSWLPYIQARAGLARLRPRSELFKTDPLPPDFKKGQATQEATDGFALALVPGLEYRLNAAAFLDAGFSFTYFNVSPYDLSPVGQPPREAGTAWEGRFGITWLPDGDPQRTSDEGDVRDAWGVRRSYGWASGEILAINNLAGVAAQFIRNVDWSETNPRSWWDNLKFGFAYDSDDFKTNQWIHPFNGAAYYNASRSNGISFWPSTLFGTAGAFEWEMAGETQRMSLNDMFSTAIGGFALGEVQYRLSSEILDNRDAGTSRVFREIAAFLVDPVRGFNRVVSGDAGAQAENPSDPQDYRPPGEFNFFAVGARAIGHGSSLSNNTSHSASILVDHDYGNAFDNPRRKPYDYIEFIAEMNIGGGIGLENVEIRGNLFSWALGDKDRPNHVFALTQHFEYLNNTAYKFGDQSVGPTLLSRFRLSNQLGLRTRVDGIIGVLLAGINSEYSFLADVPNAERLREYDYGPGVGGAGYADLLLHGVPLLSAGYRFDWVSVTNGSTYDSHLSGLDADHFIQDADVRMVIPIKHAFGIGGDASVFMRDSDFTVTNKTTGGEKTEHVRQRNPEARVYLTMSTI
jgi:hypothetical protein